MQCFSCDLSQKKDNIKLRSFKQISIMRKKKFGMNLTGTNLYKNKNLDDGDLLFFTLGKNQVV
jgi:hypothetical protein